MSRHPDAFVHVADLLMDTISLQGQPCVVSAAEIGGVALTPAACRTPKELLLWLYPYSDSAPSEALALELENLAQKSTHIKGLRELQVINAQGSQSHRSEGTLAIEAPGLPDNPLFHPHCGHVLSPWVNSSAGRRRRANFRIQKWRYLC